LFIYTSSKERVKPIQAASKTCFLTLVSAVIYGKDSKRGVEQEGILCQEGMHEGINDWF